MGRPRPITMTLVTMMVAVTALAVLMVVRREPHPKAEGTESSLDSVAAAVAESHDGERPRRDTAQTTTNRAPTARPPVPVLAAPPVIPPGDLQTDAAAPADTAGGVDSGRLPLPLRDKRGTLTINHARRREEADERAFETLTLSEAKRGALRHLNEEYRTRVEGALDASPTIRDADRSRREAIIQTLGDEDAAKFDAAERAAILRLRGKYRNEWGRQLRQ
jgi:hypothetical protein